MRIEVNFSIEDTFFLNIKQEEWDKLSRKKKDDFIHNHIKMRLIQLSQNKDKKINKDFKLLKDPELFPLEESNQKENFIDGKFSKEITSDACKRLGIKK